MGDGVIQSKQYRAMRAELKAEWSARNAPCGLCGQADIDYDGAPNEPDSFELHHPRSRRHFPHLALDRNNAVPTHCRCNRAAGTKAGPPSVGENTEDW